VVYKSFRALVSEFQRNLGSPAQPIGFVDPGRLTARGRNKKRAQWFVEMDFGVGETRS
jgi:hypothetical protein